MTQSRKPTPGCQGWIRYPFSSWDQPVRHPLLLEPPNTILSGCPKHNPGPAGPRTSMRSRDPLWRFSEKTPTPGTRGRMSICQDHHRGSSSQGLPCGPHCKRQVINKCCSNTPTQGQGWAGLRQRGRRPSARLPMRPPTSTVSPSLSNPPVP